MLIKDVNKRMEYILDCKRMSTAIRRASKQLILEAKENGLYENFGQREVRLIGDKFINISSYTNEMNDRRNELQHFVRWCRNVNQRDINNA